MTRQQSVWKRQMLRAQTIEEVRVIMGDLAYGEDPGTPSLQIAFVFDGAEREWTAHFPNHIGLRHRRTIMNKVPGDTPVAITDNAASEAA